jgi:hypothetical protein
MDTHSRRLLLTASTAIAALSVPALARAQMLEPIRVTETRVRAEKLDSEAQAFEENDWSKLKKAAQLREDAAALRIAEDPAGVVSLYWAARDRYYSGDRRAARVLMEQTADRAIAMGDVLNAATAYTEAAYICADLKDGERMRAFAAKARLLSHSPMLTEDQRQQLLTRLATANTPIGVVAIVGKK